jgi:serine/threonine protein kinase
VAPQEQYSEKADIWSLGCCIFHCMMLRPPFEGSNPLSMASKIVEGTYDPLQDPPGGPAYSDALKQLVTTLLTTDPNRCATTPARMPRTNIP